MSVLVVASPGAHMVLRRSETQPASCRADSACQRLPGTHSHAGQQPRLAWPETLQAGVGKEVRLIRVEDVVYFEADSRYTRVVYLEDGRQRDALLRTLVDDDPAVRDSIGAGVHAAALPVLSVASLVGFGAVVAALPGFAVVRDWVLSIEGGPLVSLAVATNVLSALTGSASGGLTIALDALGGAATRGERLAAAKAQLAAAAQQMGKLAANNILADLRGKPRQPFRYVDKGNMGTIGRNRAGSIFCWRNGVDQTGLRLVLFAFPRVKHIQLAFLRRTHREPGIDFQFL